jgi:hypothetical protein
MIRTILVMAMMTACGASTTPRPVSPAAQTVLALHRAEMLQWLHEYARDGAFPTDARGMPLSVFRDARGVRCPMAELIHRSGHDELVDAVVRQNNALRLADVHAGPLYDWMQSSGLSRDEIAMVQGALMFDDDLVPNERREQLVAQAAARGEVRGHLATAEIALRIHAAPGTTPASPRS